MRLNKMIGLFLGASMFVFGFLKFFHPFKGWYSVQIEASELSQASYALGILGELFAGVSFLTLIYYRKSLTQRKYLIASVMLSFIVIVIMTAGTYVHLHPNVPADVLPLNIKPPFIPLLFLAFACVNILVVWRHYFTSKPHS